MAGGKFLGQVCQAELVARVEFDLFDVRAGVAADALQDGRVDQVCAVFEVGVFKKDDAPGLSLELKRQAKSRESALEASRVFK